MLHTRVPGHSVQNATQLLSMRSQFNIENIIQTRMQSARCLMDRLELEAMLDGHTGCVNCLEWSEDGRLLASGSDDTKVVIWDPFRHKNLLSLKTPHTGNIFSVKFMPKSNNSTIVSGAGDSCIYVYDLERPESPRWGCTCNQIRVKRLATAPDSPSLIWSASEDGRVYQFDIRESHTCGNDNKAVFVNLLKNAGQYAEAKCVAVNPRRPELVAVGANDPFARLYDRRNITLSSVNCTDVNMDAVDRDCIKFFCPGHYSYNEQKCENGQWVTTPDLQLKTITYLTFSPDGNELLVNMGGDHIYLYDIDSDQLPARYNLPPFDVQTDEPMDETTDKKSLPPEAEAFKQKGNYCMENQKYYSAVNHYNDALKIAPNSAVLYLNRATAYMRRKWFGDVYAAFKDCQTALNLDPTYIKAHFRMARALLELGQNQLALSCLNELVTRFPTHKRNHGVFMLREDIKKASAKPTEEQWRPQPYNLNHFSWKMDRVMDYKNRFIGHCNMTTDIKEANFFGQDGKYIVAGSDDGNFYIWERESSAFVYGYKADSAIVNCVQPHPYTCLLATSGIDQEVRLWSPRPISSKWDNRLDNNWSVVFINQSRILSSFDVQPGASCRTS